MTWLTKKDNSKPTAVQTALLKGRMITPVLTDARIVCPSQTALLLCLNHVKTTDLHTPPPDTYNTAMKFILLPLCQASSLTVLHLQVCVVPHCNLDR